MGAQTYVNPFTPQTPIGAGIQNIAMALFSGKQNQVAQQLNAAKMDYYGAQTDKARAEAEAKRNEQRIAEELFNRRGDSYTDETAALRLGVPVNHVKGYRGYVTGANPMPPAMPAGGPTLGQIGDVLFAMRNGMLDKTVSADEIAKAERTAGETRIRTDVASGAADPTRVSQAFFATSGKAPFDNMGGTGTFNLLTGDSTLNALGNANVGATRALGNQRNASARNSNASAAQTEGETKSGVKIGAPVLVNDPEAGLIYTAPSSAIGRTPGAKPVDRAARAESLKPVTQADGTVVWTPVSEAAGQPVGSTARPAAGKPQAPRKLSGNDRMLIERALDDYLTQGGFKALDPGSRNAVMREAEVQWQKGAAGHVDALMNALNTVAPDGFEEPMQWRDFVPFTSERAMPKGGLRPGSSLPIVAAQPTNTPGPRLPTVAPPRPAQPSQRPQPAASGATFQGRTQEQVIKEAEDAMRRAQTKQQKDAIDQRMNQILASPDA